jgi:hypothetical protein
MIKLLAIVSVCAVFALIHPTGIMFPIACWAAFTLIDRIQS